MDSAFVVAWILIPIGIFLARIADVSLGTLRIIFISKGVIKLAFSLAGVIIGFLVATRFYEVGGNVAGQVIENHEIAEIAAFTVIFLVIVTVAVLLGFLITKAMKKIHLNWINRLVGAALGVLAGVFFMTALIFLLTMSLPGDSSLLRNSTLAPFIVTINNTMVKLVPDSLKNRYYIAKEKLLEYKEKLEGDIKERYQEEGGQND